MFTPRIDCVTRKFYYMYYVIWVFQPIYNDMYSYTLEQVLILDIVGQDLSNIGNRENYQI